MSGNFPPPQNQNQLPPENVPLNPFNQPPVGQAGPFAFPPNPNQMAQNQAANPGSQEHRIDNLVDSARVAVYGLGAFVSERRKSRAELRARQSERKTALYNQSGGLGANPTPNRVAAQGIGERLYARKVERKAISHRDKDVRAYREMKVHGTGTHVTSTGNRIKRWLEDSSKKRDVKDDYRAGNITRVERTVGLKNVKANPTPYKSPHQKAMEKGSKRTHKRLVRKMPNQNKDLRAVAKHDNRLQRRLTKQEEARVRIENNRQHTP